MAKGWAVAKILKKMMVKHLTGSGELTNNRIRKYLQSTKNMEAAIQKFQMKQELRNIKLKRNERKNVEEGARKRIRLSYKIGKGSRTLDGFWKLGTGGREKVPEYVTET